MNFITNYKNKQEHNTTAIHGLEGTLCCRTPNGIVEYSGWNLHEDTNFIEKLKNVGYIIGIIDEDYNLYKYNYHGGNTTSDEHFLEICSRSKE